MNPDLSKIGAYFARQPRRTRTRLAQMRRLIKAVAPRAVDAYSYQIPAFRPDGRILVWYAGFTHHCSLFPMGAAIRKSMARQLDQYETAKGTVRFPLDRPLPVTLFKRLVKARIHELPARKKA